MFNGFTVIDKKTGLEPDCEKIARTERWAKNLTYCGVDYFAITENGSLVLTDICGNYAYAPKDRFKIVFDNEQPEDDSANSSFDHTNDSVCPISFDQLVVPKKELKHVDLYVHGSCPKNPGDGAWCALLKSGTYEKIITGVLENTTNYQSELSAIEGGLQALISPANVTVYTRILAISQRLSALNTKEDVLKTLEIYKKNISFSNTRLYVNIIKQYLIHDINFVWIGKDKYDPSLQKSVDTSKKLANEFIANKAKETSKIA